MRKYKKMHQLEYFKRFGEPTNLTELCHFIINVIESRGCEVFGFAVELIHSEKVSNSHSCPIDGVSNFSRDINKPMHYPGWTGRVWIRYNKSNKPKGFGSDPFVYTNTYPGTGGYGGYQGPWHSLLHIWSKNVKLLRSAGFSEPDVYSWDYKIFEDDWPAIKDMFRKEEIIKSLKGDVSPDFFNFKYTKPNVAAIDEEMFAFLKPYEKIK